MRNMLRCEWVSRNEAVWFLLLNLLLNPSRASVKPGPAGKGMSRVLVCTSWDWVASIAGVAAELEHTGQGWPCLKIVIPWSGQLIPLTQHIASWLGVTQPTFPRKASKEHFLVMHLGILGGFMLITGKVLSLKYSTVYWDIYLDDKISSPSLQ